METSAAVSGRRKARRPKLETNDSRQSEESGSQGMMLSSSVTVATATSSARARYCET